MFKKIKAAVKNFVQKVKTSTKNHFQKNAAAYTRIVLLVVSVVLCGNIGLKLGRKYPVDVSSATECVEFNLRF
jgi:hypothetical protein